MKTKIYFQKSVILYLGLFLFLAIMAMCIYIIISIILQGLNTVLELIYLCSAIGGFILFSYLFIRFARNRIVLKPDEIYVPEHWGNNKQKIQFQTHIKYEEIYDIFLTISTNNSLNKTSKLIFAPMPYLVFNCDKDIQKAINVFYYSKTQVIKMINEIIKRAKVLNNNRLIKNGTQIMSDFINSNVRK
mgnify:CR=1 FL=1